MRKVLFVLMILGLVGMNQTTSAADNKSVIGTWKMEVPSAPYEYAKSSLIVSEVKGVLSAKIVFEDGQEIKASGIQYTKDVLKFEIYIEGNEIQITGKVENLKMTGVANTPDGDMKFNAVKGK